jgi:FKBP-type peptidyl-prolyl cis-trans isomerase FkpA
MKYNWLFFIAILLLAGFTNCSSNPKEVKQVEIDPAVLKEQLLEANKKVVGTEDEQIRSLIQRYGWKMQETGTGLRYFVYYNGNGPKALKDWTVKINYEVRLITGDLAYSSKEKGPKEFRIGSGGVESGLEEGILLLNVGDKAKFIFPSHLAWGLIGDQDRIPPKSTLIYDVEVIELKKINK